MDITDESSRNHIYRDLEAYLKTCSNSDQECSAIDSTIPSLDEIAQVMTRDDLENNQWAITLLNSAAVSDASESMTADADAGLMAVELAKIEFLDAKLLEITRQSKLNSLMSNFHDNNGTINVELDVVEVKSDNEDFALTDDDVRCEQILNVDNEDSVLWMNMADSGFAFTASDKARLLEIDQELSQLNTESGDTLIEHTEENAINALDELKQEHQMRVINKQLKMVKNEPIDQERLRKLYSDMQFINGEE